MGAEKVDHQELVYFIDPYDSSDLEMAQALYTISYTPLTSSIKAPLLIGKGKLLAPNISSRIEQVKHIYGVHPKQPSVKLNAPTIATQEDTKFSSSAKTESQLFCDLSLLAPLFRIPWGN